MKLNKTIKISSVIAGLLLQYSCSSDYDTFGVSQVTNYPILQVLGDNPMLVQLGANFTDPGVNATESGLPIDFTTKYTGIYRGENSLNTSIADKYVATYTAVNKDGFSASATRNIFVYKTGDFVNSIEGLYKSKVTRTPSQGSVGANTELKYVLIWKNSDNTYEVSDAIGGYYDIGRAYGATYAARGLKINYQSGQASVASQPNAGVGTFGGNLSINNLTVNSTNKTIIISSTWDSGYNFVSTLTQVN